MEGFESVFKNSNPLVNQVGDFLYVIGGYGPKNFGKGIGNYVTHNHLGRVNVPAMINLIRGNYDAIEKEYLMAFTRDTPRLIAAQS